MIYFQTAKYDEIPVSAGNSITLLDKANKNYFFRIRHIVSLAVLGGPNKYAELGTQLGFSDQAKRAITTEEVSSIAFDSEIENIPNSGDSFAFSQQFTIEVIKAPKNNFSISDEFSIKGSIFSRTAESTINILNSATAHTVFQGRYTIDSVGGTGEYEEKPGAPLKVNYDVKRPITREDPPECEEAKCEEDHVIFSLDTNELQLRCPKTTLTIMNNTVENLNRSGEPQQACVYPNWTVLKLAFSGINRKDKDLFNQFIRDTAALMINYTDCCGDIWEGAIISPTIPIEQDGNGYECDEGSGSYSFTFDFEGTKIGSIYP